MRDEGFPKFELSNESLGLLDESEPLIGLSLDEHYYYEIDQFSKLLSANPTNAEAYLGRGKARFFVRDFDGAIEDASYSIQLDANNPYSYLLRGYTIALIGTFEEAILDLNKSISLNISDSILFINRGEILKLYHYLDEALGDFNKAISINPDSEYAYSQRAAVKLEMEDNYGAIDDYEIAIDLSNFPFDYLLQIGLIYYNLTFFDDAIDCYDVAIDILPENVQVYVNRAYANFALEKFFNASEDINYALRIARHPLDYIDIGEYFWKTGLVLEKAICCFRIANILDPKNNSLEFKLGNIYSEWNHKTTLSEYFFDLLGKYQESAKEHWIDEKAFSERINITIGFYSSSFRGLMNSMRTDLIESSDFENVFWFIGHEDHLLHPLKNKTVYFSHLDNFSDLTDSLLIPPQRKDELVAQLTRDQVRVRCLCHIEDSGIESCKSMWDHYANKHHGISYKLRIKKDWLKYYSIYSNKVIYSNDAPTFECESPEQVIQDRLFVKATCYSPEREWRFLVFDENKNKDGVFIPFNFKDEAGVKIEAIYLGVAMPTNIRNEVISLAKHESIPIYLMKVNNSILSVEPYYY